MAVLTGESGMRELAEKLRKAKRVAVLTGAGISAESGVPAFRGKGGLWNWNLLAQGQAAGLPAASQILDEKRIGDHALAKDVGCRQFVAKGYGLSGDYIQRAYHPGLVLVGFHDNGFLRRLYRLVLDKRLPLQYAKRGQFILNLLKSSEHGLTVVCHGGVISGPDLFTLGS